MPYDNLIMQVNPNKYSPAQTGQCPDLKCTFLKKIKTTFSKISIGGFYGMRMMINHVTLITSIIKVDDYHAEAH